MHCHTVTMDSVLANGGSIALVGHPNVGKSAIFNQLTGQHVTISNYPGTTVAAIKLLNSDMNLQKLPVGKKLKVGVQKS